MPGDLQQDVIYAEWLKTDVFVECFMCTFEYGSKIRGFKAWNGSIPENKGTEEQAIIIFIYLMCQGFTAKVSFNETSNIYSLKQVMMATLIKLLLHTVKGKI